MSRNYSKTPPVNVSGWITYITYEGLLLKSIAHFTVYLPVNVFTNTLRPNLITNKYIFIVVGLNDLLYDMNDIKNNNQYDCLFI